MRLEQVIEQTPTNKQINLTPYANPEVLHYKDSQDEDTLCTKIIITKPNKHQVLIETYENHELKYSDLFYLDDKEGINKSLRFQLGR